jgi:multiple sugar transport system permease protein
MTRVSLGTNLAPWLFMAPFFLIYVLAYWAPIFISLGQSFFRSHTSGLGLVDANVTTVFVGLDNFRSVLSDPSFAAAIGRILLFGVIQVPLMLGFALLMALILDGIPTRFAGFYRLAAFLPYSVSVIVATTIWAFFYLPEISPINAIGGPLGLPKVDLLSPATVLWAVANVSTWSWTGYNMVILFSQLQAIPRDLYEQAAVDGANRFAIARRIKVPLVMPALVLTTVFSIIGTLQLYTEPYVLSRLTISINSSYTPVMAVSSAVKGNDLYTGATISTVLATLTFILSFGFLKLVGRRAYVETV